MLHEEIGLVCFGLILINFNDPTSNMICVIYIIDIHRLHLILVSTKI